jgi:5-methylcytosine-specific restriction endonuclease McrA
MTAEMKRQVWQQSGSQCENCGSKYALEIDHRRPRALGGTNALENLRLLCRSCNQRAAIGFFGVEKMHKHLVSKNQ